VDAGADFLFGGKLRLRRSIGHEFHGRHQAQAADLADVWLGRQRLKLSQQAFPEFARSLEQAFLLEDPQIR
jgi:hypothetical protein